MSKLFLLAGALALLAAAERPRSRSGPPRQRWHSPSRPAHWLSIYAKCGRRHCCPKQTLPRHSAAQEVPRTGRRPAPTSAARLTPADIDDAVRVLRSRSGERLLR
jgi:hypothetical protein